MASDARIVPTVALALVTAACGSSSTTTAASTQSLSGAFVGEIPGSGAFIGLATDGLRVRGYVCDGESGRVVTVAQWLDGTLDGGDINISQGGVQIKATFSSASILGTVVLPGKFRGARVFQATEPGGGGGLFRAEGVARDGTAYLAGWVLLPDGRQRGAVVPGSGQLPRSAPPIKGAGPITDPLLGSLNIIAVLIG